MLARLRTFLSGSLALAATAVAVGISVVSGIQRGSNAEERSLIMALGVVLVVSAHLIPAIVIGRARLVRAAAAALWLACMAGAIYGHATFFATSARDAAAVRVAAVAEPVAVARSSVAIERDRAGVRGDLADARAVKCSGPVTCGRKSARIERLSARLYSLEVESRQAAKDSDARTAAQNAREAAAVDPVGLGYAGTGIGLAVTLESVACLLWFLTFSRPTKIEPAPIEIPPATATATATRDPLRPVIPQPQYSRGFPPPPAPRTEIRAKSVAPKRDVSEDVEKVRAAIVRQELEKATVNAVRQFLGCSQRQALEVNKQFHQGEVA